jgi:coenzyme F420-0:L-glutamate ligase / coenzyme F420-1:gamma-L-glutamate ligase
MQLFPVQTGILKDGDPLSDSILKAVQLQDNDVIVCSSKVVATTEGGAIALEDLIVSDDARMWAKRCGKSPAFRQAILEETARMNGHVVSGSPQAMLTELQPDGLKEGSILAVNAGLDQSNTEEGFAIGWPYDPVASAHRLRQELMAQSEKHIAVIISDSCCRPRRLGVTAMALTVSGMDPLHSQIGKPDLFGQSLRMTHEATADQLATAANLLMGNANQGIPAVIIRDHGIPLTDFEGWVPGIDPEEDIFR